MPPKAVLNCNFFTPFRTTAHGHREYWTREHTDGAGGSQKTS
jgi:hypothetical protein